MTNWDPKVAGVGLLPVLKNEERMEQPMAPNPLEELELAAFDESAANPKVKPPTEAKIGRASCRERV